MWGDGGTLSGSPAFGHGALDVAARARADSGGQGSAPIDACVPMASATVTPETIMNMWSADPTVVDAACSPVRREHINLTVYRPAASTLAAPPPAEVDWDAVAAEAGAHKPSASQEAWWGTPQPRPDDQ